MAFQDSVGQIPVAEQFDGASEVFFQPFRRHLRVGMVVECAVDTGNTLYILQDGTDVVAHQYDGPLAVDFFQQRI